MTTSPEHDEAPAVNGGSDHGEAKRTSPAQLDSSWLVIPCHSVKRGVCTCRKGRDCPSPGKHPRATNGVNDASSDPEKIAQWREWWPDANWAVATGAASGIWVLDVDVKSGGFKSLAQLGEMPPTLTVGTGGRGRHFYFRYDENSPPKSRVGVLPGLDIRSDGGYVMLPGSQHISGGTYVWENPDVEVLSAPQSVLTAAASRPSSGSDSGALEDTGSILNGVAEGSRDDTLFRAACRWRRQLKDRHAVTLLVLEAARNSTPPFAEAEALAKVKQAFKQDHANGERAVVARDRLIEGGSFILDEPDEIPAVWGSGDDVLWPEGEGLMIAGHQGLGKTTIAQQVVLARIGIRDEAFLGLPVKMSEGRVLYLAMDRPRQAARSFRRMVEPRDRAVLDERLVIWRGPLPIDIMKTGELGLWVREQCPDVDTVVVDSVKDFAGGRSMSDDAVGGGVNAAWQELIADNIELLLLHHERKAASGTSRTPTLDNIFGSTLLTSGLGSVIALSGDPGSDEVTAHHVKQPAETIGPLDLRHLHKQGVTEVVNGVRLTVEQVLNLGQATVKGIATMTGLSDKTVRRHLKNMGARVEKVPGSNTSAGRIDDEYRLVGHG